MGPTERFEGSGDPARLSQRLRGDVHTQYGDARSFRKDVERAPLYLARQAINRVGADSADLAGRVLDAALRFDELDR